MSRALVSVLVRRTARLDVEHAFFGELGGMEACRLALGMAVESRQEIGFDSPREFLDAVLGGLDFGADGGGDGLDGAVEVLFCGWLVGSFGRPKRAAAPLFIMPLTVGAPIALRACFAMIRTLPS